MALAEKSARWLFNTTKEYTNCMQIFLFTAARRPQKRQWQHQQYEQHHREQSKNAGKSCLSVSGQTEGDESRGNGGEMGEIRGKNYREPSTENRQRAE